MNIFSQQSGLLEAKNVFWVIFCCSQIVFEKGLAKQSFSV
jgi:hypothetical protein